MIGFEAIDENEKAEERGFDNFITSLLGWFLSFKLEYKPFLVHLWIDNVASKGF